MVPFDLRQREAPDVRSIDARTRILRGDMPLQAGTRLGPYEVVRALGAGGMGAVYEARDTRLDRQVAVKVLAPELASDPDFRARFTLEAKAISSLNHPPCYGSAGPAVTMLHRASRANPLDELTRESDRLNANDHSVGGFAAQ